MAGKKETIKNVLVALLPKVQALNTLKTQGWYHIPVENAPQMRWPPKLLAFYQGRVFGKKEAYQIRYFGKVDKIDTVPRRILFPDDSENRWKADRLYYRLRVQALEERPEPIISYRPRRLVFIPTTMRKFCLAEQINDLFDGSPLEDRLWSALKYINVPAERQWKILVQSRKYYLDFAVFCRDGKLAIETDGYTTHHDSMNQIDYDTWRQNEIELDGWRFLRYTRRQVNDDWTPYLAQIQSAIEQLGGAENPARFTRKVDENQGKYIIDGEKPL